MLGNNWSELLVETSKEFLISRVKDIERES
jgi:hypothetical protein